MAQEHGTNRKGKKGLTKRDKGQQTWKPQLTMTMTPRQSNFAKAKAEGGTY